MIKYYLVGGAVRDKIIGLPTKDYDYAVEASSYEEMRQWFLDRGGKIWLEKPEYFTIRGKLNNIDADYVLCRKDGQYFDGRHPESVEVGTIFDDLGRRDFTMNAVAIDQSNGDWIDPHNGIGDIKNKIIRCVGDVETRFSEDSLRMFRAIRFAITKGFSLDDSIYNILDDNIYDFMDLLDKLPTERIYEEVVKCFKHNTYESMEYFLRRFPVLGRYVFLDRQIWLKPTMEEK